ncbi:hypothetical protein [Chryseobacterium oryzae]|uniref:Uncharacterized protein n=1 Tax=Chryseobacterium oryzae TaxID=2929799 RepID=A0ABY4BD09_9FLAO|nr:hypothetical protein [Chryseobacterium oryzae]UOE37026.1 hypothetical protein MTP08_08070 [Chryseobacterium oryzae]
MNYNNFIEIENDNYQDEIMQEFVSRNGFNVDDIFDFRGKVFLTKEIALNIKNGMCNINLYVEFVAFQKDLESINILKEGN